MHILHVNKFLYRRGGAESYMLDLAGLQSARGHDVSFFAMTHPSNDEDANADLFPPQMELNPPPDGFGAKVKSAAGVIYRPSAKHGMEAILDRVRPDVVHLHNIYHQLSPSVLRPLAKRGIPAVMTLHDYKLACPTYQFLDGGSICEACVPRKFHNATLRRCNRGSLSGSLLSTIELSTHTLTKAYDGVDVFICPSDFMRVKMRESKVFPERLVHIPHFCDLSQLRPAEQPGEGVLFAGRLSHEKGVDTLVEAARLLPGTQVTIAGDGPERESLEKLSADLGVTDRVQFLGRVPADVLHGHMRDAAVVVAPSRWYENQPMTILEAFGSARPVVTTRLGGLPELVSDGETGRLVAHNDPQALAGALAELAGDPGRAHAMGQEARRRAIAGFDIDTHLSRLDDAYGVAAVKKGAVA